MSLQTWKAEFYPVESDSEEARKDPLGHSLRKWQGLKASNLKKHGVIGGLGGVRDVGGGERFMLGGGTCALCEIHYDDSWDDEYDDEDYDDDRDGCGECPLKLARGGVPCDRDREDEVYSPWKSWSHKDDPKPMILWLERAANKETHPNV